MGEGLNSKRTKYQAGGTQKRPGGTLCNVTQRGVRCAVCGESMAGRTRRARYCSAACRQVAYRRRQRGHNQSTQKRSGRRQLLATPARCAHCGGSYWRQHARQRYCAPTCRKSAYKARRADLAAELAHHTGCAAEHAQDVIEAAGMPYARDLLARLRRRAG